MKTDIHPKFRDAAWSSEAEDILRSCVHCGFCTATCPTYQELGDERDGPRGRIYLIKQFLEEGSASTKTMRHLDRCLTCRACETTCPSGVQYGKLVDLGRHAIEKEVSRPILERLVRWSLLRVLPFRNRFGALLRIGQFFKPLLPKSLAKQIPQRQRQLAWPSRRTERKMVVMKGCVQASATPNTNASAARVLDRLGITLLEAGGDGCCGAASHHLSAHDEALDIARQNIDAWWPLLEDGAEAIVITASGCGTMIKDYGDLLKHDPAYAEKAKTISLLTRDLSEVLLSNDVSRLQVTQRTEKVAIHCPCTLQHGQQLPNAVDRIFEQLGVSTASTKEKHLCCGSAGTYSILQPTMSSTLLKRKLDALTVDQPDEIVTANVGCQMHLASESDIPVRHWIELVDQLSSTGS